MKTWKNISERHRIGDLFQAGLFALGMSMVLVGPVAAEQDGNLLLAMPPILAARPSTPPVTGDPLTIRVYVAGESVEEYNHFNNSPLNINGSLNDLGQNNNTPDEYGWMVPFSQRLQIRDPNISVSWVGAGCWQDQGTYDCSTGLLSNSAIGHTSAQAGSTVETWIADHISELTSRQFCYDVAFASRGGNDLDQTVPDNTYRDQLRSLILDLDSGSSCRTHPLIYVTAHLVDVSAWDDGISETSINSWLNRQRAYYVTLAQNLVTELGGTYPAMNVRFIDMWTPFVENKTTTAFPTENWLMCGNDTLPNLCWPDMDKIHRDGQHPRRLASIFAGENVADQVNISELRSILGQ